MSFFIPKINVYAFFKINKYIEKRKKERNPNELKLSGTNFEKKKNIKLMKYIFRTS
jgi:hypothetical protein